jgi:hypothetical protein
VCAVILAFVNAAALAAVSVQAAPLPPKPSAIELSAAQSFELVRDGCGRAWHRSRWREQFGYWHWGDCISDGDPYGGWGAGSYYPPPVWRSAPAPWGWGWGYPLKRHRAESSVADDPERAYPSGKLTKAEIT